jgi:hypothetical protein
LRRHLSFRELQYQVAHHLVASRDFRCAPGRRQPSLYMGRPRRPMRLKQVKVGEIPQAILFQGIERTADIFQLVVRTRATDDQHIAIIFVGQRSFRAKKR